MLRGGRCVEGDEALHCGSHRSIMGRDGLVIVMIMEAEMPTITEAARDIPVVGEVDVAVVGGGPAGFAAATAAARLGARTLLIERYGYLGGLATGGLVLFMDALGDKKGERVIGGLGWEALERLRALGGLGTDGGLRLHADSELLKIVADNICVEAGAALRLHSWAVRTLVDEGQVTGVVVESKEGRQAILSKVCVDASGDGDVAAGAGAAYRMGCQAIGLNAKVGSVDRARYFGFRAERPEEATALREQLRELGGFPLGLGTTPHSDEGVFWVNILGLDRHGHVGPGEGDVLQYFAGELSAIDVADISHAEVELRRRIMVSLEFHRKHIPGFENVRLLQLASQLGVRDSRCLTGLKVLTQEDVLAEAQFDDTIGMMGVTYSDVGYSRVPYGALVPRDLDGLLMAGRCISVDPWTQHSARLIPPAMMTGQAAGTAAALAVQAEVRPRSLDVRALRRQLVADGAIL